MFCHVKITPIFICEDHVLSNWILYKSYRYYLQPFHQRSEQHHHLHSCYVNDRILFMYIISEADVMIDIIWFMPLIFIGEALLTPQLLDVNQFCEWFKLRVNCQELLWCTTWSSHHLHFLCLQLPSSFEKILGVQCKMNLSVDHTLWNVYLVI